MDQPCNLCKVRGFKCDSRDKVRGPKTEHKAVTSNELPGQIVFKLSSKQSDPKREEPKISAIADSENAKTSSKSCLNIDPRNSIVLLDGDSQLTSIDETSRDEFDDLLNAVSNDYAFDKFVKEYEEWCQEDEWLELQEQPYRMPAYTSCEMEMNRRYNMTVRFPTLLLLTI